MYLCKGTAMPEPSTIYDPIRRKEVRRTPEEEVRQGVVSMLQTGCGVPLSHIAVEYSFQFNGRQYRADVVVFDRSLQPQMLVECKAPQVTLTEDVVMQTIRYNYVLCVPYIFITNGNLSYLCRRDGEGRYQQVRKMPSFEELCNL